MLLKDKDFAAGRKASKLVSRLSRAQRNAHAVTWDQLPVVDTRDLEFALAGSDAPVLPCYRVFVRDSEGGASGQMGGAIIDIVRILHITVCV